MGKICLEYCSQMLTEKSVAELLWTNLPVPPVNVEVLTIASLGVTVWLAILYRGNKVT